MKAYVAVTDGDWYRFLRERPDLDEVNFWQPGGSRPFRVLQPNELFLFKLHYPENAIVGGGFFAHASQLPLSLAWEVFEEKNGAESLEEVRRQIQRYRPPADDYQIGCIILRKPFFFDEQAWIEVPSDFSPSIVQGKQYDLTKSPGRDLLEAVEQRLQAGQPERVREETGPLTEPFVPVGHRLALVGLRLGQGTFRVLVTDTYQRRCAITGEKVLPVLEASHIRPVNRGGDHRIDNGLLLRSDVHTLFDSGYLTVTSDYQIRVSRKLKGDFHNGEYYYQFNRVDLRLPAEVEYYPRRELLEWHSDTVFRG